MLRFLDSEPVCGRVRGRVSESNGRLQKSTISPDERLAVQSRKHEQVESAYTGASGPNWVANAVDRVVLATPTRHSLRFLAGIG